jgi:hypothetical protein
VEGERGQSSQSEEHSNMSLASVLLASVESFEKNVLVWGVGVVCFGVLCSAGSRWVRDFRFTETSGRSELTLTLPTVIMRSDEMMLKGFISERERK